MVLKIRRGEQRGGIIYTPARIVLAIRSLGVAPTWIDAAAEILAESDDLPSRRHRRASPNRVTEWAMGQRAVPAWVERAALRVIMRHWLGMAANHAQNISFAHAISPVYGEYIAALYNGVAYESLMGFDQLIGALLRDRGGLTRYVGMHGIL